MAAELKLLRIRLSFTCVVVPERDLLLTLQTNKQATPRRQDRMKQLEQHQKRVDLHCFRHNNNAIT